MSTEAPDRDVTPLASLVNAGVGQTEAVSVTDCIFMSRDVSNAYLVTTPDGDVLINAGTIGGGARHKALFDAVRSGATLRYAIITQSHPDHFGGLPAISEPGTQVVVQRRYPQTRDYYTRLSPFFAPRTGRLWASVLSGAVAAAPEEVTPHILVDDHYAFDLGGRRFELLSTPEGETVDNLSVWMPNERVVFTGNLFGPVFLSMPFLVTLRGDKPRSVNTYLRSLDRILGLRAAILVTGHGDPIVGADRVEADLTRLRDAVAYVNDATIAGMNAGKDVHTLMREIQLPEHLKIGEFHGKVSWAVRSIWEEYSGWFHYDSTTSLYGEPRSSVDHDLVELAGGATAIALRARQRLDEGKPLQAIHLIDIALGAEPGNAEALQVKRTAHQVLLDAGGGANLSETMWLRSEIAAAERALGKL
jgi:alkyl sulfatase BDS1-like metallo-beta-lactamase superfamily hydrolase